jgi:hypothetical protein
MGSGVLNKLPHRMGLSLGAANNFVGRIGLAPWQWLGGE